MFFTSGLRCIHCWTRVSACTWRASCSRTDLLCIHLGELLDWLYMISCCLVSGAQSACFQVNSSSLLQNSPKLASGILFLHLVTLPQHFSFHLYLIVYTLKVFRCRCLSGQCLQKLSLSTPLSAQYKFLLVWALRLRGAESF